MHWLIGGGGFSTALALKPEFVEARCNMVDLLGGTVQWDTWQQQRRQLTNRLVGELHEEDSRSPIPMPRGLRCVVQCVLVLTVWLCRCWAHLPPQLQLAMNAAHAAALDDLADEAPAIASAAEPPSTFMQPRRVRASGPGCPQ